MLDELSAEQYEGWIAWMRYYQPYPNREDVHWARLISLVHNQWSEQLIDEYDASPYLDRFEEELTLEELLARIGITE